MAPFDKSKRSVVKHKTRKPFAGGGGGGGGGDRGEGSSSGGSRGKPRSGGSGFKVGPRHAPDGAYLGKAKRIKANLIANAKTKQRFYKSIKGKGKDNEGAVQALDDTPASLGRFAPEAPAESEGRGRGRGRDDGEEGEDTRRRTSRAGPPPPDADDSDEAEGSRRRRRDRAGPPPPPPAAKGAKRGRDPVQDDDAPAPSRPAPRYASREEALAARKERQEKWNKASGSETGRRRGQPDLGSRMEVLLDKIRAT